MSRTKLKEKPSSALTAVAFQDHLARNLDLSLPRCSPRKVLNTEQDVNHRRNRRAAKAVVNSGKEHQRAKVVRRTSNEAEYVLDAPPEPLSLAQKFGLVNRPAEHLSDGDWQELKVKSNDREDSALPCAICKETFGMEQQVLISCSHVFHKNCLAAFERFTGKKTCPMCRREQYQTRVIYEGARICRLKSAIRIQATWRGYVVRRWYNHLRETVPPKEPILRKKYYEDKLSSITERMVRSCGIGVDDFLHEIDQSIVASREVFRSLASSKLRLISEDEWQQIYEKVKARDTKECPICIMPFMRSCSMELPAIHSEAPNSSRRFFLLSCTHLFHRTCLEAFEELSMAEEKVCPVCRSSYQKQCF